MSIDWQEVKTNAWRWYLRVSAFWMLQTVMAYLWACMVAGKPVGPIETVHFVNHTTIWRPVRASAAVKGASMAALVPRVAPLAEARAKPSASVEARGIVRTTQRLNVFESHEDGANVVGILDAGVPVDVRANFTHGWTEIDEVVTDKSHAPAHGWVKGRYLQSVGE
jgi:hypothetical protein